MPGPGNMPLHIPESFALLRRLAKIRRLYSGMLMNWLTILSTAAPTQKPTTLIW